MERLISSSRKGLWTILAIKAILPNDRTIELNTLKFEEFVMLKSIKATSINNTKSPTGNSITSTIEPTALSSSYNTIKIDLEVYPAFNGQTIGGILRYFSVALPLFMESIT